MRTITTAIEITNIDVAIGKYRALPGNTAKTIPDFVEFLSTPSAERELLVQSLTLTPTIADGVIRQQYV